MIGERDKTGIKNMHYIHKVCLITFVYNNGFIPQLGCVDHYAKIVCANSSGLCEQTTRTINRLVYNIIWFIQNIIRYY